MLLSAVLAAPLILAVGLPSNLFGSAPATREWHADHRSVRVIDGETIILGDKIVRLAGVAAPARGATCEGAARQPFDCGGASAAALTRLVLGRAITCRIVGQDGFGRGLGECEAGGTDLGRTLVRDGFALAVAEELRSAELAARDAGRGLWAGGTGAPPGWQGRN